MLGKKHGKNLTCRNSTILFLKQNPAFDLLRKKKGKCKWKAEIACYK